MKIARENTWQAVDGIFGIATILCICSLMFLELEIINYFHL